MNDITTHVPTPVSPAPKTPTPVEGPNVQLTNPRLRLWPALVILGVQWLLMLAAMLIEELSPWLRIMTMFLAPMVGAFLMVIWWMFASRVRWSDRFVILVAMLSGGMIMFFLAAASDNMARIVLLLHGLSIITLLWGVWLLVTFKLPWTFRRIALMLLILLGWTYTGLLRWDGCWGDMKMPFVWRWIPTAEENFLATHKDANTPIATETLIWQPGDWPGFRGEKRDGKLTGVRIDWKNRPREVWRQLVGPGWSSFTVIGKHVFTQEQRGENEAVVCYAADSGTELWAHNDATRFTEAMGGPGPRATPTFHNGMIYAFGATGILNCLDAGTGKLRWTRDVKIDSEGEVPKWGFASSPLIFQDLVIVFAGGPGGNNKVGYVAAYDKATGQQLRWKKETGKLSYCSPQLATLHGVDQVLISTDFGVTSFHPTRGDILWQHEWSTTAKELVRIVQPTVVDGNDVLLGTGMGLGTQRLHVSREGDTWKTETKWTSEKISPYFNDLVVHEGHIYGFDGPFLTCVDLENGKSRWRARGYGNGQVLFLAEQKLLLILAEKGRLAVVEANPEKCNEIASFEALDEKSWNHPVIAHGKLYIRNSKEAICYQLTEIAR